MVKFMKDELGERMKSQYEHRTRFFVPRRTYSIIRLDGKSFHTYTKGLKKPFDRDLYEDMDNAIIAMFPHIQGAVFAYTQSDEISVLITDFALPTTSAWFDGNIQKISSVSSSIITAEFNKQRVHRQVQMSLDNGWDLATADVWPLAYFDSRIFTIPDRIEVMNYFIWRNQDCSRNSISMVAQSKFSHKELQNKSTTDMIGMLEKINDPWKTYTEGEKFGRLIVKESYQLPMKPGPHPAIVDSSTERTRWVSKPSWKFTENKEKLLEMIPQYA
jgi:tRNA(His) guanylyltransferase